MWQVVPELHALVKALREEHGATRVGAQGFCWGGLYTALLLAGAAKQPALCMHRLTGSLCPGARAFVDDAGTVLASGSALHKNRVCRSKTQCIFVGARLELYLIQLYPSPGHSLKMHVQ